MDVIESMLRQSAAPQVRLQRLDLVRLPGGQELIVTKYLPSSPVNCYEGVKPKGLGKPYVFGPKHRPVKIGTVNEDHPALVALKGRRGDLTPGAKALSELLAAVEAGNLAQAQAIAKVIRSLAG